jgi:hypothetical protein
MKNAKKFLRENLTKSKFVATKIFNVNAKTLSVFIRCNLDMKNEKHNKILQDYKKNIFDNFIRSLLQHEILFASEVVFNVIMRLKQSHRLKTSSNK